MHHSNRTLTIGPAYLLKGFSLLTHREVRPYVIVPLLLNTLLFIGLSIYAVGTFSSLLEQIMSYIPSWLDFVSWILWLLFAGLMLLIYGYCFTLVGNFIASPFYGLLAEKVEAITYEKNATTTFTWQALVTVAGKSFYRELLKLGYFLPRIVGILALSLLLSFIPVLNLIAPVIAFTWGSWWLSLQYLDYPADNNQKSFAELRNQARQQRLSSLGFGGAVLIATTIPFLNMLTIPASVIGATLLWHDRLRQQ